jgi:hypothetical protein
MTAKPGRPALVPGKIRAQTSVSLTHEQQIQLRRLGGSKWLRAQIDKATPQVSQLQPLAD